MNILGGLANLIKSGKQLAIRHAPGILMGMGTVGVGSAVILAVKAGPKAVSRTEQAEMEKAKTVYPEDQHTLMAELTWQEKLAATYQLYIPPVGLALFGLICFWAAHGIDLKRQAVVAGLAESGGYAGPEAGR